MKPSLLLGSASARRKEILSYFSYPFSQVHSPFPEESVTFSGDPEQYANILSKEKAAALLPSYPTSVILTADTVVFYKNRIFNKPASLEEAFEILSCLNGSSHSVFTSVTVASHKHFHTESEETKVQFHKLSQEELKAYHAAYGALDKAGGYAIQDGGGIIVKEIHGCFFNVLGLPLHTTRKLLFKAGINLWDYLKS